MVAIASAILGVILGIIIGLFAARKITAPIKVLQGLMAEASEGNLLVKAVVQTKDEIGQLCESFNTMITAQLEIVKAVNSSSIELAAASQEIAASSVEVSEATTNISKRTQMVAEVASSDKIVQLIEIVAEDIKGHKPGCPRSFSSNRRNNSNY